MSIYMLEVGFGQLTLAKSNLQHVRFLNNLRMGCLRRYDDISITATACEVQAIGFLGYTATRVGFSCRRRFGDNLMFHPINNSTIAAIGLYTLTILGTRI